MSWLFDYVEKQLYVHKVTDRTANSYNTYIAQYLKK